MFGKKPRRESASINTLIGAGTTVTGDVVFRGGLHLDGRIVGDLGGEEGASSELTIGASGVVEGAVLVDNVVLNGTVLGDVAGRERVELGPTARVDGNVRYKVLEMAAGARVNGRLIHEAAGRGSAPPAEGAGREAGLQDADAAPGTADELPGLR
jgi:cytoskeletal protein CcmA (bactofilin family)